MVVADHASLLMCMWELYMAYMLVNYALFIFLIYSTLSLFSLGKKAKVISHGLASHGNTISEVSFLCDKLD